MKRINIIFIILTFLFLSSCSIIENKEKSEEENESTSEINKSIVEETTIEETTIAATIALTERINADIRNAKWGDSIETVKKYENAKLLIEDIETLSYSDIVLGSDVCIHYIFSPDYGLYKVIYAFMESHTNESFYITEFDNYKSSLTEKYGIPYEDKIINTSDLADNMEAGLAIEFGFTVYRTKWTFNNSNIFLGMYGDNGEIQILVSFEDNNYKEPIDTKGW